MKFQIKDFVDLHSIEIEAMKSNGDLMVMVAQSAGSMRFVHPMRPDQARFMASALQMAADQAEAMQSKTVNIAEVHP